MIERASEKGISKGQRRATKHLIARAFEMYGIGRRIAREGASPDEIIAEAARLANIEGVKSESEVVADLFFNSKLKNQPTIALRLAAHWDSVHEGSDSLEQLKRRIYV